MGNLKKMLLFLLLVLFMAGCRPANPTDVASHIVTEIAVTCQSCNEYTRRYYNTHEKMQKILLYLRSVTPGFTPDEDPEPLAGRIVLITLHRADGTTKVYRQKGDRSLQEGNGPWKKIKPEWGASLWQLLQETESDPEEGRSTYRFLPRLPGLWRYSRWVAEAAGRSLPGQ